MIRFRDALILAPVLSVLGGASASGRALAADEKEACLSAADQGQSMRDDGRYSGARDEFVICSRSVCPKLVHDQCTDWLHQLDESIPTVIFGAKDDQGTDVPLVHVLADGKAVANNLDGKPLQLDPGPHDIRFERDNPSQSVSLHIVLRAGEKNREVRVAFPVVDAQPEKPETPSGAPTEALLPAGETPPGSPSSPSFWNARSITSLSLLGAGAVSVGLGLVFGLQSRSEASQADAIRNEVGNDGCGPGRNLAKCKALDDTRDAQNRDAVLNMAFYAGGGALAAGAVAAWLFWPKSANRDSKPAAAWVAPTVALTHAGVALGGAF